MKLPEIAVFRECQNQICRFRFPDIQVYTENALCPLCNAKTIIVEKTFLTNDYRTKFQGKPKFNITAVLDNIRSVHNVGSIFRTAVGLDLNKIYLCGISPTPEHRSFQKTSFGAEKFIEWEKSLNSPKTINFLQSTGYKTISLEITKNSKQLDQIEPGVVRGDKFAIVVGNEIAGIDPMILNSSDLVLSIPISGANKSFNVAVAFGIAVYQLRKLFNN